MPSSEYRVYTGWPLASFSPVSYLSHGDNHTHCDDQEELRHPWLKEKCIFILALLLTMQLACKLPVVGSPEALTAWIEGLVGLVEGLLKLAHRGGIG